MLPLSTPTILAELESVKSLIEKWVDKVADGVPGVDTPMSGMAASGDRLDLWLNELIGELRLVSAKSNNIAEILATTLLE